MTGTNVPPHDAPQHYISIILSGEAEVVTSDGEARRLRPGDVIFFDDLTGKGHATRRSSTGLLHKDSDLMNMQQVSDNCFAVLNENNRISDTPLATSAAQVSPSRASGHPQTGERIQ